MQYKKFQDSIKIDDWEIETNDGWKELKYVYKTIPYQTYHIELENGLFLNCADTHIVIDENYNEIFVKDLIVNETKIICKDGISLCIKKEKLNLIENMYDVEINSDSHLYYVNNILSHNTITVCAYLLYEILFNRYYTIGILANNATKSREILSRVKLMYEEMPHWLKTGVVVWNKGYIELSNRK